MSVGRRRQAAFSDALARGVPAGCAAGGFPGAELSIELTVSRTEAGHLIDDGADLTSRLRRTLAGMAAGLIDADKAGWITYYTRILSPADAALADEFLAGEAPDLQADQLARKAAALEKKLNPEGARARRERSKRDDQRVEARREASGNASLAGRELDVADVLASKAYLDALASRLRASGVPGSLDRLRALAFADVTQGRDPLAHGCARGPRPRLLDQLGPQPPPAQEAQAIQADQAGQLFELLRRLGLAFTPIARASRDPAPAEDGYVPSRALKHLVRARSATCDAPGCHNLAVTADLDHPVPVPDGPTSQANLAPVCQL